MFKFWKKDKTINRVSYTLAPEESNEEILQDQIKTLDLIIKMHEEELQRSINYINKEMVKRNAYIMALNKLNDTNND